MQDYEVITKSGLKDAIFIFLLFLLTGRGGREKLGKVGLEGQMEEMIRQAEEARVGVLQALGSRYVDLTSAISDTALLQQRVESSLQNVTDLQTSIDQDVSLCRQNPCHEVSEHSHITQVCHMFMSLEKKWNCGNLWIYLPNLTLFLLIEFFLVMGVR